MAFRDFTFPDVGPQMGLTFDQRTLFPEVPPHAVSDMFADLLRRGVDLGSDINNEKARSEFIIAPVLLESRLRSPSPFSLFSGIELNVDPARGLAGECDFIMSRSPLQSMLAPPVVAIVKADNDSCRNALGPCIAAMVAAEALNAAAGQSTSTVYGATTTGASWRFLRLIESHVTIDLAEVFISDVGRLLRIFSLILDGDKPSAVESP